MTGTNPFHFPTRRGMTALALAAIVLSSCSRQPESEISAAAPQVLIDARTREVFTAAPGAATGSNGRKLSPAMYCLQCAAWHPVPPLEVLQRSSQAGKCPKHQVPLLADGALPPTATRLP